MARSALEILQSYQTKKKPYTGLKVTSAPTYTRKLKVTTAPTRSVVPKQYPVQRTGNPQKTAPRSSFQKTVNPQAQSSAQRAAVQRAATQAQIQRAAVAAKAAAQKEVARRKEALRQKVQGGLDSKVVANKEKLGLSVKNYKENLNIRVGADYAPTKLNVPEWTDADRYKSIMDEWEDKAKKEIDNYSTDVSSGLFGKGWDKISFGSDRRKSSARSKAQERAEHLSTIGVAEYGQMIDHHNILIARLEAEFKKQQKNLNPTQLNTLAAEYDKQIKASLDKLTYKGAATEGRMKGYGIKAEEELSSLTGKILSGFGKGIEAAGRNPIFKYTLGEGSESKPSLVTAPARLYNFVGNLNTKDRDIYRSGGGSDKRTETGKTAWQATFNQRNANIKPYIDKEFDKAAAFKLLEKGRTSSGYSFSPEQSRLVSKFKASNDDTEKTELAKEYWDIMNKNKRFENSAQEFASDPLSVLAVTKGATAAAKSTSLYKRASDVAKKSKVFSWSQKASTKIKYVKNTVAENKTVKKLFSEYKSPEEQLQEAITAAKKTQGASQDAIIARINQINKKLVGKEKLDISVFDDLAKLTDDEARVLQRTVAGKLSRRDALRLIGKNKAFTRESLTDLAKKWEDFSEKLKLADNIGNTRVGKGKAFYSPYTKWIRDKADDLDGYNFRKKKRRINPNQSAEDLKQGAIDRYFKSDLDSKFAKSSNYKKSRLVKERDELLKRYDDSVLPARKKAQKAYDRTQSKTNKIRKIVSSPTRLWKKSVLKYRPAWTVNNTIYNAQAGVLSGGSGYVKEQAKMLRRGYAKKSLAKVPANVRTNLAKEIGGKSKLDKFYAAVENNPRTAAYNALIKKGFKPEAALKRVDKYFFNYKIRNIERPVKAMIPFYAFQKNLAKASLTMPFDTPIMAKLYNGIDKYQKNDFKKQFDKMIPELKEYGYTEEDIEIFRAENAKYFEGRLRVGDKYYTTPFNAFSEKGLSGLGPNPYIAAASEYAASKDSFGRKIKGKDSTFLTRLRTKFPQADMGYEAYKAALVDKGIDRPATNYIGKAGSEGYGLTKTKQGYDETKPNYTRSLDPRAKTDQDLAAFFGKPRGLQFDTEGFKKTKKLAKVVETYFSNSERWKDLPYPTAEKERQAIFKKFGVTPDEFYKGLLSKYDSEQTVRIKKQKETAREKNKALYDEYAKQPKGTKGQWATKKLDELNAAGYFDNNPFLKGFDWINSDTYSSAEKARTVQAALKSGDWSAFRKKYGSKTSAKALAYRKAKASGDWSAYTKKFGSNYKRKESPYKFEGKHFKTAASMEKYKTGQFWRKYGDATPEVRKQLLAENPEYNQRKDWTQKQWDEWKTQKKASQRVAVKGYSRSAAAYKRNLERTNRDAERFKNLREYKRGRKKVVYA
ncbi:hypothetical protein [uncultured Kiloniella sp.]|uniref:hypothetical protein n=1 Tax=uncultured Kiloniella sp. TaxID=1133091 RepID=UPI002632AA24|nr:hypothetical protein [uncultured Kiloniella sp.]